MHQMHVLDEPCALKDGHAGRCRTRQAYDRQRARHAEACARYEANHPARMALARIRYNAARRAA